MALAPSVAVTPIPSWRVSWRIYRRIFRLLRPHLGLTLATLACTVLATGFALIVPWLLGWVIDTGIQAGRFDYLVYAALGVLVISGLRGLFAYGQGYYSQALSVKVAYDLRNTVYNHLQHLSFDFHDDSET